MSTCLQGVEPPQNGTALSSAFSQLDRESRSGPQGNRRDGCAPKSLHVGGFNREDWGGGGYTVPDPRKLQILVQYRRSREPDSQPKAPFGEGRAPTQREKG